MRLPTELKLLKYEIENYAKEFGLDFFPVIFEVLDFDQMNEIASFEGFPNRYPHWKFGMEYERMQKSYTYGLQKIYEMVINNNPCYAYLLECNTRTDQKTVIAHVYGHCDFFKGNLWFLETNRKMVDEMANHAARITKYIEKFGFEQVEKFIDTCLSIDNLIDYHSPFIERREKRESILGESDFKSSRTVKKIRSKEYMTDYINPPDFLEMQKKRLHEEKEKTKKFPEFPQKDVLLFLIENAPLERWQQDVLSMVREESYYFAPQIQTKIMNEGWATYWHSKIMTTKALKDSELIDYADHHSGTLGSRPGRINPYKIGLELFRDIEDRWNKGKFGKDYEECEDINERKNWNKNLGLGRDKIFEIRKIHNDITFIDTFLTREFCEDQKLFVYKYNDKEDQYEISDRDFEKVKKQFLFSLTNFGKPIIMAEDGNFENRGELYLVHRHEGIDLRTDYAKDTLINLWHIWGRPVHIDTIVKGRKTLLSFDGKGHSERDI